jgi:YggT family protein
MFVLANFVSAVGSILEIVLKSLEFLIVVRALLSWVNPDPNNTIVQIVYKLTEPVIYPIRKLLPFSLKFGLDISPLIAWLVIFFLQRFLVSTLSEWAIKIRMG